MWRQQSKKDQQKQVRLPGIFNHTVEFKINVFLDGKLISLSFYTPGECVETDNNSVSSSE